MKLYRMIFGMFLVALADFASGILITHVLVKATGYDRSPILQMYAIGAILTAALIDSDILLYKFIVSHKPKDIGKHRDLLHKPLYIIPIFILLYIFVSPFWAYLVSLCFLAHFIHDSTGSGYGVKWLHPFSKNTFKFCVKRIICIWTPEYVKNHPFEPTLEEWIEEYYLKWSPENVGGILWTIISMAAIIFW